MAHATTVAELARDCELDAGAMTRLLDRLEAKGLIRACGRRGPPRGQPRTHRRRPRRRRPDPGVLCKVQNAFLQASANEEWQQLKDCCAHAGQRQALRQKDPRKRMTIRESPRRRLPGLAAACCSPAAPT
jgi:predicted ArsR family transcriptional regulator